MKHLGDITKINGAEIPVVDIITGGSPCQDLSVAGLRKGLQHNELGDEETTRSGLFMDQLRIVKEMRAKDVQCGRNGVDVRPRYMVWENVPGAFSVNQGKDFQAVLTEIVRIIEPTAPDVPMPDKGWPYAGCIYGEMGNWSIAYRLHDAQYWGVPQRRKRIALVADFNGLSAPEVLFDPQLRGEAEDSEPHEAVRDSGTARRPEVQPLGAGLSRDSEPGGEAGEGTSESPFGRSDGTGCYGIDQQGGKGGANFTTGVSPTLAGDSHGTPHAISFQERAGCDGGARESSCRLNEPGPCQPSTTSPCFSIQGNTIDRTPKMNGGGIAPEYRTRSTPLTGTESHTQLIAGTEQKTPFVNGTLQSKKEGHNLNTNMVVRVPTPSAFKTPDTDGGAKATLQHPSEPRLGGVERKQTLLPQGSDLYNGTLTGGWRQA